MDVFNTLSAIERNSVFYANGSAWQVWNKPKNANFVYFFLIGGGGGGGGGRSSGINSAPGGGGGGSSSITTALFAANMLPDTLYIKIGLGGIGGVPGSPGVDGELSHICFEPNATAINVLLKSGDLAANSGNGSINSTNPGAGGTGGTLWTYTNFVNGDSGLISTIAGSNGSSGTGIGASPNNVTPTLPVTGGAGGGAVSASGLGLYNGGSIIGSSFLPTVGPGINSSLTESVNGGGGITFLPNISSMDNPMFFTGGAGGGSSGNTGGVAGKGGNASFGSGGGGGGGAYNNTGGTGGNGGDGLALIVTL